jgi:hypothetical protein
MMKAQMMMDLLNIEINKKNNKIYLLVIKYF